MLFFILFIIITITVIIIIIFVEILNVVEEKPEKTEKNEKSILASARAAAHTRVTFLCRDKYSKAAGASIDFSFFSVFSVFSPTTFKISTKMIMYRENYK